MKVVLALGAFDLFHRGHVEFLRLARTFGDRLVVAVNTDEKIAAYKRRPLMATKDRLAIIEAIRFVDHVEISDDFAVIDLVRRHGVDVIVHGDDWTEDTYLRQIGLTREELAGLNVRLQLVPYYPGVSTTQIIERIARCG